jgi:hypothetical protein
MKTRGVAQDEEHGEKKSLETTGIPIRSGEVGVCAEFSNNNIYTLSANNKAKDREQIRYTKALVLVMGKGHMVKASKEYKPETVLVDISKKCNAIRMESQCKYIVAIQGQVCIVLDSTQLWEMTLGIMYDEKLQRRIRIDTQGGGTLYTSLVSAMAMETEELYQGVQYSALIVDEIILNVVVTTRSVVGTMDGHLIIIFQEWKDKKLWDGILKVASNLMMILRSEGWAVGNDYDTCSIGGPMEYSINPGVAVDVRGADSRLNQDNYLDVVDDITGVNPPIIMVDELDDGVVQVDLVGGDAIEQQYVVVTTECIIVVGTTETVRGKTEAHSNDKFNDEVSVVGRRIYRRYTEMSRVGYSIVTTYPSRDGMLWDSGNATAETDRETCMVLDDIGDLLTTSWKMMRMLI